MAYRVVEERVRRVAETLGLLGLEGVLRLEEEGDSQRREALRVAEAAGRGPGAVAGLLVALASYRLAMRGEEWWACYGDYMTASLGDAEGLQGVYEEVRRFLLTCKGASIGREAKLRRVSKAFSGARARLEEVYGDPDLLLTSDYPSRLLSALMAALSEKRPAKTLVFSVKIAYYHARRPGELAPLRLEAPIPVDVRVACVTYSSGMVEGPGYRGLVSKPEAAWRAWGEVEMLTGIPMPHLDTVAWLTGWAPRDLGLVEARARIAEALAPYAGLDAARRIAAELVVRECE